MNAGGDDLAVLHCVGTGVVLDRAGAGVRGGQAESDLVTGLACFLYLLRAGACVAIDELLVGLPRRGA